MCPDQGACLFRGVRFVRARTFFISAAPAHGRFCQHRPISSNAVTALVSRFSFSSAFLPTLTDPRCCAVLGGVDCTALPGVENVACGTSRLGRSCSSASDQTDSSWYRNRFSQRLLPRRIVHEGFRLRLQEAYLRLDRLLERSA